MKRARLGDGTARETIRLNVGGRLFETTPQTLSRSPFFVSLLSGGFGEDRDEAGNIFIDRSTLSCKRLARMGASATASQCKAACVLAVCL